MLPPLLCLPPPPSSKCCYSSALDNLNVLICFLKEICLVSAVSNSLIHSQPWFISFQSENRFLCKTQSQLKSKSEFSSRAAHCLPGETSASIFLPVWQSELAVILAHFLQLCPKAVGKSLLTLFPPCEGRLPEDLFSISVITSGLCFCILIPATSTAIWNLTLNPNSLTSSGLRTSWVQLTLEQHWFQLPGSTYVMLFFNKYLPFLLGFRICGINQPQIENSIFAFPTVDSQPQIPKHRWKKLFPPVTGWIWGYKGLTVVKFWGNQKSYSDFWLVGRAWCRLS